VEAEHNTPPLLKATSETWSLNSTGERCGFGFDRREKVGFGFNGRESGG
jgi:hypothetical protein